MFPNWGIQEIQSPKPAKTEGFAHRNSKYFGDTAWGYTLRDFSMDIYQKTAEKLGKLGRNEAQMSEVQFVQYEEVLKKCRKEILAGVKQIFCTFCTPKLTVLKSDLPFASDEIRESVRKIATDAQTKEEIKRLKSTLFQTYSLECVLDTAGSLENRILYEAYAPYWVSKCVKTEAPSGAKRMGVFGEAWYSLILDMYWNEKCCLWVSAKETAWRIDLPPTKELCMAEYEEKKQKV